MAETAPVVLSVRDLTVDFQVKDKSSWPWTKPRRLRAVSAISFELQAGETLGVVGESGCGKSTLARALLNLCPTTSGSVVWMGQDMSGASQADWMSVRSNVQMIFQDPLASLDPRMTVQQIIAEPLRTHQPDLPAATMSSMVLDIMGKVGLSKEHLSRYPHEFSGGQAQRIGIARALILRPKVLICDEPVSALDVSIQAQIVNLLRQLQKEFGLALVFIAHDLAVVRHISHRIMVMYLGKCMEISTKQALYAQPRHPYTRALLSAIPVPDPERERSKVLMVLHGDLPSPLSPPSGCVFRTRCPQATAQCADTAPTLTSLDSSSQVACVLSGSIA